MMTTSLSNKNYCYSTEEMDFMEFFSYPGSIDPNDNQPIDKSASHMYVTQNSQSIDGYNNTFNSPLDESSGCLDNNQTMELCSSFNNFSNNSTTSGRTNISDEEDSEKHKRNFTDEQLINFYIDKALEDVCTSNENMVEEEKTVSHHPKESYVESLKNVYESNMPVQSSMGIDLVNGINVGLVSLQNNVGKLSLPTFENTNCNIADLPNCGDTISLSSPIVNFSVVETSNTFSKTNEVATNQNINHIKFNISGIPGMKSTPALQQPQYKCFDNREVDNVASSNIDMMPYKNILVSYNNFEKPVNVLNLSEISVKKNNWSPTNSNDDIVEILPNFQIPHLAPDERIECSKINVSSSLKSIGKSNDTAVMISEEKKPHIKYQLKDNFDKKRKPWETYSCDKCNFKTKWSKNYKCHLQLEHQLEKDLKNQKMPDFYKFKSGIYICQLCYFIFSSKFDINTHYLESHLKTPTVINVKKAMDNGRNFTTKTRLGISTESNIKNDYREALIEAGVTKTFVCYECKLPFDTISKLLDHQLSHKNITICSACNMRLACNAKLREHIRITHLSTKPFICFICDKGFSLVRYLRTHMKTHTNDSDLLYLCKSCPKDFASKSELLFHERSHRNGINSLHKPLSKLLAKRQEESESLACEKQSRPCNQCGITEESNMHLALHLEQCYSRGEKTVSNICPICYLGYSNRRKFLTHLLHHNKNDPVNDISCPKCQSVSSYSKGTLSHHSITCGGRKLQDSAGKSIEDPIVISDSDSE